MNKPYLKDLIPKNTELYRDDGNILLFKITCPYCKISCNFPESKRLDNFLDGETMQCQFCETVFIISK